MKKVLIISASPRKNGNSDILCDSFAAGALSKGHQVEKIRLAEMTIHYCLGCGACYQTHHCIQKDDMHLILEKARAADVIVLATPVYFYAMNGQLKTMIDRFVPCYEQMTNKDFYYILTAADTQRTHMERVIESLNGFTEECLENAHIKGIIYGLGVWQKGEVTGTDVEKQAFNEGQNC